MDLPKEEKSLESKESPNNKSLIDNQPPDDDSSSHESIFFDSVSNKKEEEKLEEENNNENNNNNNNDNILNMLLNKKKKRELTQEQKEERIKRNIERYCTRNDKMLELLEKINNNEITRKNINEMMRLLAIDLSDTKKLTNKKALISQKKNEMFNKLFDLTFEEYQFFWFQLTQGKYKKGNAQLINSGNMRNAKLIYDGIIEKRKNNNKEKKKEKTVREIIDIRNNMDIEDEKFDEVFLRYDPDISSDDDSLDSSVDDSLSESDDKSEKEKKEEKKGKKDYEKELKEMKEKEMKEKELKEKELKEKEMKEKEMKEKKEKMKKLMDEEDEIDIFN